MKTRILILRSTFVIIVLFLTGSFLTPGDSVWTTTENQMQEVLEQIVKPLPITGPLNNSNAQVSGLAWYGDYLIILPQYPAFPSEGGGGNVFAIPKADILAYLADSGRGPLNPTPINFEAPDLVPHFKSLGKFEGYEAIIFDGNHAYLTIEIELSSKIGQGYLVASTMATDLSVLSVDTTGMVPIDSRSGIENMAEETLILAGTKVLSVHEANGASVNAMPFAHVFDKRLDPSGRIQFPSIPYRITDATSLDELNRFWVINYFYPGDVKLDTPNDFLADRYGEGPTHANSETIERLVELQYSRSGITLVDTPPIQLQLLSGDKNDRNWEGIVRLDDMGFLIITDEYPKPKTILGFVANPKTR